MECIKAESKVILMVVPQFDRMSSVELLALHLSLFLSGNGMKVDILTDWYGNYPRVEACGGTTIYRKAPSGMSLALFLSTAWFLIRRRRHIGLIHCHGLAGFSVLATKIARLFGIPTAISFLSGSSAGGILENKSMKNRLYNRIVRKAQCVIVSSEKLRQESVSTGIPRNRVFHLPVFANTSHFTVPTTEEKLGLRTRFGATEQEPIVLFADGPAKETGIIDLLHAWRHQKSGILWILTDRMETIQKAVMPLKLQNVRFMKSGDTLDVYRAADIFAFPSAADSCPLPLVQAMSCGLACIASRTGEVAEIMEHEREGILIQAGSVEELAAALHRCITNTADRDRWAQQAARTARENYALENIGAKYQSLFCSLMEKGKHSI